MGILDRILRAGEGKKLKALQGIVPDINVLEDEFKRLSDAELQGKTAEFRQRLDNGAALDDILVEAFATTREAADRVIGQRHFDVQMMGGAALHFGWVAEMKTGEGKTLVSTLAIYLNALGGDGVHLVTVNEYLARFQAEWMGRIYKYLGMDVGLIVPGFKSQAAEKRRNYAADITYGTNNEFGFDYLRDNMVVALEQRVQRKHVYAIIDEVDSILIDEARTPLIISGPVGKESDAEYAQHNTAVARLVRRQMDLVSTLVAEGEKLLAEDETDEAGLKLYKARLGGPKHKRLAKVMQETGVKQLVLKTELAHIADRKLPASKQQYRDTEEDLLFVLDEKGHTVHLTDQGVEYLSPNDQDAFLLPDISIETHRVDHDPDLSAEEKIVKRDALNAEYAQKSERLTIIHQLLKAHALYEKDVNYVVVDGQVLIVDEFTGRTMPGRRWSEGLHQAIEAKEGVPIQRENQTLAS
ncbi:MAG: DEAD/DEAH box helicase, partial [Gemmatimonadaceae bacterium]